MMTWLAIKAIKFYQKFISPYKGFSCAHRVSTGEISCSAYGKKAISRFGLITGIKLLNRRFYDCAWHAKKLKAIYDAQKPTKYKRYQPMGHKLNQGGFVDCDCSGCDSLDCDLPNCKKCSPSFLDCVPDSCDCGGDNKKRHSKEFQEKRDSRNKSKYDDNDGVSLDKNDDGGDGD